MHHAHRWLQTAAAVQWLALGLAPAALAQGAMFQQVDVSSSGVQGNGITYEIHVSGDGRHAILSSASNNLVPGDTNGQIDGFVRDLVTGTTERISVGVSGQQSNGESAARGVSHDGRYVVFASVGTNLHPSDTESWGDIYVRDRVAGTTELISVLMDSTPSIHNCLQASISADGRFVAFDGGDPNFVPGDTNASGDVFVRDRLLRTTTLVSVSDSGEIGNFSSFSPSISADGRKVAFLSYATNFHPSPTGNHLHVYLRDLDAGKTIAIDLNPWGRLGDDNVMEATLSADGSTVAFVSQASDLVPGVPNSAGAKPVIWRENEPLSIVMFPSGTPGFAGDRLSLSGDGRYMAFLGQTANWVPGDPTPWWDVFVRDMHLLVTNEVSSLSYAAPANHSSLRCSISDDGRVIGFVSQATNLVPGTLPGNHAFVRIQDPTPGLIYCAASPNVPGCKPLLSVQGTPSAGATSGHGIDVAGTLNAQLGLFVYSTAGAAIQPFGPPWLCVGPPIRRIAAQQTGGAPPPTLDCSGALTLDFNAWIATGADPALVPGTGVWLQGWTRDPTSTFGALLSEALAFQVGP
jgi:Tol biopolymer transport system component